MLDFKILMASAFLMLVPTGGMAFAQSLLDTENSNATSASGVEKITVKAQLKPGLLDGWYDIKKFRLGVSDGSEICPSNNCGI